MSAPTPIKKAIERVYTLSSGLVVRLQERHEKLSVVMPGRIMGAPPDAMVVVHTVSLDVGEGIKLDEFEAQMLCRLIQAWMGRDHRMPLGLPPPGGDFPGEQFGLG